jgi:hypothetical protein
MQASRRTRPRDTSSLMYHCCHGPENFRTGAGVAKGRGRGQRCTKLDQGLSVRTGCKAHMFVKQLEAQYGNVSAVYLAPEEHTNHPESNQSQVSGPDYRVAAAGTSISYQHNQSYKHVYMCG